MGSHYFAVTDEARAMTGERCARIVHQLEDGSYNLSDADLNALVLDWYRFRTNGEAGRALSPEAVKRIQELEAENVTLKAELGAAGLRVTSGDLAILDLMSCYEMRDHDKLVRMFEWLGKYRPRGLSFDTAREAVEKEKLHLKGEVAELKQQIGARDRQIARLQLASTTHWNDKCWAEKELAVAKKDRIRFLEAHAVLRAELEACRKRIAELEKAATAQTTPGGAEIGLNGFPKGFEGPVPLKGREDFGEVFGGWRDFWLDTSKPKLILTGAVARIAHDAAPVSDRLPAGEHGATIVIDSASYVDTTQAFGWSVWAGSACAPPTVALSHLPDVLADFLPIGGQVEISIRPLTQKKS